MKSFFYFLLFCIAFSTVDAQMFKKNSFQSKTSPPNRLDGVGAVTYVHFANSVNGPFTSPATILTTDSFFVKLDITPYGTAISEYYIDVNRNGVIDSPDMPAASDTYIDNNTSPLEIIDLDPATGVIVAALKPDNMPSMQIIARVTEGPTSAEGIMIFQNLPKMYTLSGIIHNTTGGVIAGAMIWVGDSSRTVGTGDVSDGSGHYSVPVDAGTYYIHVSDFGMSRYSSFDTIMAISGNKVQDFYLSPNNSYIRGYVEDENLNPIANVEVRAENNNSGVRTDGSGMYKLMVAPGSGRIKIEQSTVVPTYMSPNDHYYTIGDNDSIVNNDTSNFTCFTTNATITGDVKENGQTPTHTYIVNAWGDQFGSTFSATDAVGHFVLHVHDAMTMPLYGVNFADWDGNFPLPPGMYPDTSYWGLSPGAVANFNLIPAETLFVEPFLGDGVSPSWMSWNTYNYNNPWGPGSEVLCWNNRLTVQCNSNSGLSGLGVVSHKPFSVHNIEYKVIADPSQMNGSNNTIKIILSDEERNWEYPQNFKNSLQLIWEKSPIGLHQWRLVKSQNGMFTDLCTSSDSTGYYILFQFIDPDTLRFKIGNTVYYNGPWGNNISLAYLYLTEFNLDPNDPTPVYFDELFIGALGTNGVREVGGELPAEFKLDQNYPNPFNPITAIRYHVPSSSFITLKLFNTLGQEVMMLVNEQQNSGNYEVAVNADRLPSGVYYYRLIAADVNTGRSLMKSIRKAVLVK